MEWGVLENTPTVRPKMSEICITAMRRAALARWLPFANIHFSCRKCIDLNFFLHV